jgi:hypothetical protein
MKKDQGNNSKKRQVRPENTGQKRQLGKPGDGFALRHLGFVRVRVGVKTGRWVLDDLSRSTCEQHFLRIGFPWQSRSAMLPVSELFGV